MPVFPQPTNVLDFLGIQPPQYQPTNELGYAGYETPQDPSPARRALFGLMDALGITERDPAMALSDAVSPLMAAEKAGGKILQGAARKYQLIPDKLPRKTLSDMGRSLKANGFDIRGADDVLQFLKTRQLDAEGYLWHEDWIRAYEDAVANAQRTAAKKAEKETFKNVNWKRLNELGATTDWRETGYLTPTGKQIDLSGKFEGGSPGMRSLDHREAGGTDGMLEAMASGYIRIMPEANGVDLLKEPTKQQYLQLKKFFRNADGEIYVDMGRGLGKYDSNIGGYGTAIDRWSGKYPAGTRPEKIINDIKTYYSGETPKVPDNMQFLGAAAPALLNNIGLPQVEERDYLAAPEIDLMTALGIY